MSPLTEYRRKRRIGRTPEPRGTKGAARGETRGAVHRFVVQKHRATQLHYDFRLEARRVLVSWAVPKGPSLDPAQKRFATAVEDHPLDYATFEGVIPAGEYGGGTVMVWDTGTYELEADDSFERAYRAGALKFTLRGKKLRGSWRLVRMRGRGWLLIKALDRYASHEDITVKKPRSVLTRRLLAGIARAEGGDVAKARTGDPH